MAYHHYNMQNEPGKTFEVSVVDSIGVSELHPGSKEPTPEQASPSKEEVLQKVLERRVELAKYYVPAHTKKSRLVTESDIPRVVKDGKILHEMALTGRANYTMVSALAHPQMEMVDPLRFYVTLEGVVIINPVIRSTDKHLISAPEGCMTFDTTPMKEVTRYKKIYLRYQTLMQRQKNGKPIEDPLISEPVNMTLTDMQARIAQHEIDHLNGIYIYSNI